MAAVNDIKTVVVEGQSAQKIYSDYLRGFRMKINVYPALGEAITTAEIEFVHPKKYTNAPAVVQKRILISFSLSPCRLEKYPLAVLALTVRENPLCTL